MSTGTSARRFFLNSDDEDTGKRNIEEEHKDTLRFFFCKFPKNKMMLIMAIMKK